MMEIFEESPSDKPEVEALLDLIFGPGRHTLSSYRLRDGVLPVSRIELVKLIELDIRFV